MQEHEPLQEEIDSVDLGGAATLPAQTQEECVHRRNVYSFCMCPGGQIVPTATADGELCINGMSFSKRDTQWANSALVATVQQPDWEHLEVRSLSVALLVRLLWLSVWLSL